MELGLVFCASAKVLDKDGLAFRRDSCSCESCFSLSSSCHDLASFPEPDAEDIGPPDFADCIVLLRASFIESASALAAVADVKENV